LAGQDTQTPPLLNAIYEQITRAAAGYRGDDLVDCSDIFYDYVEDQVVTDGSLRYPDLVRDEIPEGYRLRLQNLYNKFVNSQDHLREQLVLSRVHQQGLHADLLAAEHERERLVSTLGESDKKRRGAKARCAAEVIVSKLRADLTAAMDHLDRQTEVVSSKDHTIQLVTEKSQVAQVRLKYAEDKITHLNAKLQRERDRRLRITKELLDEQVRVQDRHESEIQRLKQEAQDEQVRVQDRHESEIQRLKQEAQDEQVRVQDRHESEIQRLKQEAQDAQEQLDTLRGAMSQLHADGRSPLDHDHSARYRQPTTPLPPERIHDTGTPPCNSPSQDQEGSSTHQDPTSEVTQDHWAALKKLFERMRQGEYNSAPDAVKPNSEQQESRLQDELAVTKEQLCLAEEEVLTMRRDQDQSREALRELKTHIFSLQFEWEMCKAMLREAQDARRSNMTKLAEVIGLLRVSQAESEASQFRCSQVTFLCAALRERVTELEAKVKKPTGVIAGYFNLNDPEITPVHTDSETHSRCPTGPGTGMCAHPIYAVL
jgi:chromosome segregation ATPase